MEFQEFSKNYLNVLMVQLIISTSLVLPAAGIFLVIFSLDIDDSDLLYYRLDHLYNITRSFMMFLNNYHYIQSSYTSALQYQYLEYYLYLCCLFRLFI